MQRAYELGFFSIGKSRPNPAVGAVVVREGKIVGEGATDIPGKDHAEVSALKSAGELARGSDLYVTLEPCCHYGRTPPCTSAVIAAGIRRVFFAHADPNPLVRGKSRAILERAGIEVFEGKETCDSALFSSIEHYFSGYDYFVKTARPFVEVKIAQTKNGCIAHADKRPLLITHEKANIWNHKLRALSDALLVGGSTLESDDPKLSLRLFPGNSPRPIVFTHSRELSPKAQIFSALNAQEKEFQTKNESVFEGFESLTGKGIPTKKPLIFSRIPQPKLSECAECVALPGESFEENWSFMIDFLGRLGMHRLMVEPGATLFSLLLKHNFWNRINLWTSEETFLNGLSMPSIPDTLIPAEVLSFDSDTLRVYLR